MKSVQCDAKPAPVPVQRAQTANTRWPLASSAVTRQATGLDPRPRPARVVGGPQLRPERPAVAAGQEPDLANPGGAVGAVGGRRVDVAPGGAAVSVRAQDDAGGRGRQVALPGGSDWPITQPVAAPTKVTDSGGGPGRRRGRLPGRDRGAGAGLDATVAGCCGRRRAGQRAGGVAWRPVSRAGITSWGITTAAMPATARARRRPPGRPPGAAPARLRADALERARRRQQRLAPARSARCRVRRAAQARFSPSAARSRDRAWYRSALTVPSGRPSMVATSRTGNPA